MLDGYEVYQKYFLAKKHCNTIMVVMVVAVMVGLMTIKKVKKYSKLNVNPVCRPQLSIRSDME